MSCPSCDRAAAYHGDRDRALVCLFGPVRYRRAWYYCRRCGHGICPFDEQAGITSAGLSSAVEQLTTLAGAVADSFERGATLLAEMTGLHLSESTVQRTTEQVGAVVASLLQDGTTFGPAAPWDWRRDAEGKTVAYVSLDHTGVRQQGPGAKKADGRMAAVAAVFNPPTVEALRDGKPPGAVQARYISGLYALPDIAGLLRRQATQVGMEQAEVWVVLTDGGAGLEQRLRNQFNRPDLVAILDFYHAASYLEGLARCLHPGDEDAAKRTAEQWCGLLKEEGGLTTEAVLREWDWPARKSAALREQLQAVLEYFGNNRERMDYPAYAAAGWCIGSGVVESACKTVVGRLKGPGMRWSETGTHEVCHVRALYRSEKGQWQDFWLRRFTHHPPVHQLK